MNENETKRYFTSMLILEVPFLSLYSAQNTSDVIQPLSCAISDWFSQYVSYLSTNVISKGGILNVISKGGILAVLSHFYAHLENIDAVMTANCWLAWHWILVSQDEMTRFERVWFCCNSLSVLRSKLHTLTFTVLMKPNRFAMWLWISWVGQEILFGIALVKIVPSTAKIEPSPYKTSHDERWTTQKQRIHTKRDPHSSPELLTPKVHQGAHASRALRRSIFGNLTFSVKGPTRGQTGRKPGRYRRTQLLRRGWCSDVWRAPRVTHAANGVSVKRRGWFCMSQTRGWDSS